MLTNIQRWGDGQGIRIPQNLLETVKLTENDSVEMEAVDGVIIIRKAQKAISFETLFKDYEGEYKPSEYDWGPPVGKEVL